MSSGRLLLIFLAVVFLIIAIVSSKRIAGVVRNRFPQFFPNQTSVQGLSDQDEITPTPSLKEQSFQIPSPTEVIIGQSSQTDEIPQTGPNGIVWLITASSLTTGIFLLKKKA